MRFLPNLIKWSVARWSGDRLVKPSGAEVTPAITLNPDGWGGSPRVVASLVSGATYGQTGTTVTVTATAHGITAAANGFDFYWPGSAEIPAGFYKDLAIANSNTLTFTNPVSQSIASGTALTAPLPHTWPAGVVYALQFTVPAGTLRPGSLLKLSFSQGGDSSGGAKYIRVRIGGVTGGSTSTLTTSPFVGRSYTLTCQNDAIFGSSSADATGSNTVVKYQTDYASPITVGLEASVAAAASHIIVYGAKLIVEP